MIQWLKAWLEPKSPNKLIHLLYFVYQVKKIYIIHAPTREKLKGYFYHTGTWEAQTGFQVGEQPGLHSETIFNKRESYFVESSFHEIQLAGVML